VCVCVCVRVCACVCVCVCVCVCGQIPNSQLALRAIENHKRSSSVSMNVKVVVGVWTRPRQLRDLKELLLHYLKKHPADFKHQVDFSVGAALCVWCPCVCVVSHCNSVSAWWRCRVGSARESRHISSNLPFSSHLSHTVLIPHCSSPLTPSQLEDASLSGGVTLSIGVKHLMTWQDSQVSSARTGLLQAALKYMRKVGMEFTPATTTVRLNNTFDGHAGVSDGRVDVPSTSVSPPLDGRASTVPVDTAAIRERMTLNMARQR
jgi:small-conductance mechanosensitive channel